MMRRLIYRRQRHALRLLFLASALCHYSFASSQLLYRDYQYIKDSDPWLTSHNSAALTRYASASLAEAELSLVREKGGFTNYSASADVWQADARVESFFRLSQRSVLFGSMSYNSFSGKDMAGSVFTPCFSLSALPSAVDAHRPFDIVEDSLGNEGDKHCDTYRLTGGFGTDLFKGFSLGARIDYTAANYAKYKDLRHQNKLMDLQLTAGFYLPFAKWGALGANYQYRRTTESIDFGTYGKGDKTYVSLVDYGTFMGHIEQFGNSGFTDKSREMPLVSDYDGLGLQLSLHSPELMFYNSFTYARRRGYYGRKSPYTITYTDHHADLYTYQARLTHRTDRSQYAAELTASIENLQNDANTYRELSNENGATHYEYYGLVKMANKLWTDLTLAFTARLNILDELPVWTLQAGLGRSERQQTSYLYPYFRRQDLSNYRLFASAARNIATRKGVWTLAAHASFQQGEGQPYEDLTFQTPSDKQVPPPTMDAYLAQEYLFLTAPQYLVGGSVKYAFLFPGTAMKTYAKATVQQHKANQTGEHVSGRDHTQASIAIGCNF